MTAESCSLLTDLSNVKSEWDGIEMLRDRIRSIGRLVVNKPAPGSKEQASDGQCFKTVDNVKYNLDVLKPLLGRLAGCYEKIVEIRALESEIAALYKKNHMAPTPQVLSDQAWSIRGLLYVVKGYLYREKPPKEPGLNIYIFVSGFPMFCSFFVETLTLEVKDH